MRWGALLAFLAGLGLVGFSVFSAVENLDLVDAGATAIVTRIEPGGRRKTRKAWFDTPSGPAWARDAALQVGDQVVYDPQNPRRSRAIEYVGNMNEAERWWLVIGLMIGFLAVVTWIFERFMTNPDEEAWIRDSRRR
jgi:hypothetical protein